MNLTMKAVTHDASHVTAVAMTSYQPLSVLQAILKKLTLIQVQ